MTLAPGVSAWVVGWWVVGPSPEPWALEAQVWGNEAKRLLWGLVESKG